MALIRLFFNPLDGSDKKEYPVDPGIRIIDFLQDHYPDGFDGIIRVFAGIEEVQIEDLDRQVADQEQVTIVVMPSGAGVIGSFILRALVAVAIGYVINLIFRPSVPGGFNQEAESPVYSLGASQNSARLGDPIAVHYGSVSYPPDYASAPYVWYWTGSNDMFVDELLCLGHGKFDIEQIYIGDTPITAIDPGTVQYWLFDSSNTVNGHNQTMGAITNKIWSDIQSSAIPFPFRENVFTSPEVENYEIGDFGSDPVTVATPFAGDAFATYIDGVSGETILGHIDNVDSTLQIRAGDILTLAASTSNNGDFLIGSVVYDPNFPAVVTLFQDPDSPTDFVDESPLNAATTYTLNTAAPQLIAGPFRAQKLGQQIDKISIDIVFAKGLFRVDGNEGTIKVNPVPIDMQYTCQRIDETTGDPIDAPLVFSQSFTERKRNPVRSTFDTGPIPAGAYEVTVERLTPISDDDRITDSVTWAGLKGAVVWSVDPVYGDVTLMAIRMKATNGLGSAARSRIRVTAKRAFDTGDSSNPITAIKDVWTNTTYGLGRDINDLDLDVMDVFEDQWGVTGPFLNGSFDQRGTGFDGMQAIASLAGAKIVQDGGLTSIVLDKKQEVRTAMFTSANIVAGSMEIRYTFDTEGDYDSVQVEYRDAESFQPKFVTYPSDGTLPDTYTLFGCTDDAYALEFATYLYNVKTQRRKLVRFQTELEGLIPKFGDRIAVSTPLADWGQSGVVVNVIDPDTVELDQNLDWTVDNIMMLRDPMGVPVETLSVVQGATANIAVFATTPTTEINGPETIEPTSYAFGTSTDFVRDFMMTKMTPKGDTIVEIEGQNYLDEIYDGAPPHMNPCIVTVPTTDIAAVSIWDELDAESAVHFHLGVVGVDGSQIVAAPSGRKMIVSNDLGETWTEYNNSLPDHPDFPGDDTRFLVPTKWVYSGGWFAHMRSKNSGNNDSFVGSFLSGSGTWTVGDPIVNGRYSRESLAFRDSNAVVIGRPANPNNAQSWRYNDRYGNVPAAGGVADLATNSNGYGITETSYGFLGMVLQDNNNQYNFWKIKGSSQEADRYTQFLIASGTLRYISKGSGVLFGNGWNDGAGGTPGTLAYIPTANLTTTPVQEVTIDPALGQDMDIAAKNHIWLSTVVKDDFGKWAISYSIENVPTQMLYPCDLILPDDQSSSGTNGSHRNLIAASDGWWVAWYRKASDQKVRIIKFELETYSGGCT